MALYRIATISYYTQYMDVLLLGASGRIGQRTATELTDRGHAVTGVSRSGTVDGVEAAEFVAVAGDATNADDITKLATGHDAVVSALGPSDDESPEVLTEMMEAVIDGLRRAAVDRLVWTGGAGGLKVGPDTMLIETEDFPEEWEPIARAAIDAYDILDETDDLKWSYVAPAALIEPGERTGAYRTAEHELVADEEGDSYISMEDFAIALADELEEENAVYTYLGTGY
ncbi:hypothetical protein Harman_29900 [Haloarcula mannanilytica]|uniref:NAD(P)-binding domain-containing protein n=2 Tax=Haloarcula mannanilytica TaxID=2509225 RepID=A0A4C2EKX7_9EURY|nr:NAD(P)H-binding protein [Haloarcula mannanilytica]GCF15055.1 hypothetical protein Harman_29900 [Haloarcula mannanilytica]